MINDLIRWIFKSLGKDVRALVLNSSSGQIWEKEMPNVTSENESCEEVYEQRFTAKIRKVEFETTNIKGLWVRNQHASFAQIFDHSDRSWTFKKIYHSYLSVAFYRF